MVCFRRKMKLYDEMFRCQFNLSGIYQRAGNLSQALRFADMAIKIAVTKKDKLDEKEGHINKGRVNIQHIFLFDSKTFVK